MNYWFMKQSYEKKINILLIVTHLGHGGAEKILIKIANLLVDNISKVRFFCPLNVDNFILQ